MEKLKKYGKVGIITHLAFSASIFTGIYTTLKNTNKTNQIIRFFKLQNRIPKSAGTFMVSAILYKVMMPARLGLTLVTVPIIVDKFNLSPEQMEGQESMKRME